MAFGLTKTSATRSHIVVAAGTYSEIVTIDANHTSSPSITIHGGGATLTAPSGNDSSNLLVSDVATTIRNLNFMSNGTAAQAVQSFGAPCTLQHVKVSGGGGIGTGGNMFIDDLEVANAGTAIDVDATSHLTADRVVIHDCFKGIRAGGAGARLDVTNLLVFDTTNLALDLSGAVGAISSSTIADSGNTGTTPVAVSCSSGLALQSSIVWTPNGGAGVGGGCTFAATIIGPTAVAGAMNTNPMFVDETHRDYHLAVGSPARDAVDSGPPVDFEGDARPQGPRFDIGADEAR